MNKLNDESKALESVAGPEVSGVLRRLFVLLLPGLAAVIALMPVVALGPIAFSIRRDFELSVLEIGFAFTAYFLASTLLVGVGGWLTGRFGTLAIVRIGLLCSALLSAAMAFAGSSTYVVVLAIVAGANNGLVTPSINLLITQLVPAGVRGLAFGIKVAAAPAASGLAALGAWTAVHLQTPWQVLYWGCCGLGAAVLLATIPMHGGKRTHGRRTGAPADRLRSRRPLVLLAVGGLLGATGTAVLPAFLVDGLLDHGLDPGAAASLLVIGSGLGFMSRVLVGGLSDRWPEPLRHIWAVVCMMVVSAASLAVLAFAGLDSVLIAATVTVFTIGWAWPGLIHHAVIATHADAPAAATSYMQTGTFLGSVIGPLGFGYLAEYVSFTAAWGAAGAAVLGAAAFLAAGVLSLDRTAQPA